MRLKLRSTIGTALIGLAAVLASSQAAVAQDGTILGTVTDADTRQPLDGASVFIVGTARGIFTSGQGRFQIQIPPGNYTIRARLIGYQDAEQQVTVLSNQTVTVDFQLAVGGLIVDELVVTGSRTQRSALETPVPVDVVSASEIRSSPHTELAQVIREIIPSFNASHQTIADGSDHINPASLRGLGPDQVLVLVNGKRRHASALTHVNGTFGRGTVGVDLNSIPMAAVARIEVLRDGAAAQYGSDAIAGVVNVVLKDDTEELFGTVQAGVTGEGDGEQVKADVNYGFRIGERGFFNVTGEFLNRERTNRADTYQGEVFFSDGSADDAEIAARGLTRDDFSMKTGQGEAIVGHAFFNSEFPLGENAEFYAFGGVGHRKGEATGFYRRPIQEERVVFEVFPTGFLPEIHTEIDDQALSAGVKGRKGSWDFDLSVTHGRNSFRFNIENTNNASLGAASPISFDAGRLKFRQTVGNFDAVRLIDTKGAFRSLSLVAGGEFRLENYGIGAGQFESYSLGNGGDIPGVDFDTTSTGEPKAAGSQVFPGFQPANEVDRFRNSIAAYLGFESQISDQLQLDVGGRFENYSDFGSTVIGKAAARLEVVENFALRGAVSTSFRAPSLHQLWFNNVSTQFVIDPVTNQLEPARVLTGNNKDPVTRAFGVPDLKEETSVNLSGGFTWRPLQDLSITGDVYFIDISDRIVLSSRFSTGNSDIGDQVADILEPFSALGVTQAQFFANAVDTETFGVDVVVNYVTRLQGGILNLTGSVNFTDTEVTAVNVPQSIADQFGIGNVEAVADVLFNREERNRLEDALPRQKGSVSARYSRGRFSGGVRGSYFGSVEYKPTDELNDETFDPRALVDVDLGFELVPGLSLTVGANNVFNTFPDRHFCATNACLDDPRLGNYGSGNFPFSRRVTQFGTNGGFYFARLSFGVK